MTDAPTEAQGRNPPESKTTRAHIFDLVFLVGLGFKGLDGLAELLFGIPLLFLPQGKVSSLAHSLTADELSQDPHDLLANLILHGASHLNSGSTLFIAAYLVVHGLVKVALVAALIIGARRVYPWAIAVLIAFTLFQAYELVAHPSLGIFLLTALDVIIVVLTWREWRQHHVLRETFAITVAWLRPKRAPAGPRDF
jgi:uncharacterized membrane protein